LFGPFELGDQGKKDYNKYFEMLHKFFFYLKKEQKLNPNFLSVKKETDKRIFYFDAVRKATEKLDWILFDQNRERFDQFLDDVKKYNLTKTDIMQIWGSLLINNILIFYSNIETLLLTVLKGAKYGNKQNEKIIGDEPLGILLPKIFKLNKNKVLNEDVIKNIIDIQFRNALAHGWYRIENHQLVYFEKSLESEPKVMDEIEIIGRIIQLQIFGMALSHIVLAGEWQTRV